MTGKSLKQPRGVALRRELWDRLDAVAHEQKRSRNQVIEMCLELHLPQPAELPKQPDKIAWRDEEDDGDGDDD